VHSVLYVCSGKCASCEPRCCCDALIQSSTLQNNWPAVEQGPLFWQPLPALSQHITLPLGGQKGAISASLGQGDAQFAEVILAKNNTKHGAQSLVTLRMMGRDKDLSVKINKIVSGRLLLKLWKPSVVWKCRCGGDESTQYLCHFLSPRLHLAQGVKNCYATEVYNASSSVTL